MHCNWSQIWGAAYIIIWLWSCLRNNLSLHCSHRDSTDNVLSWMGEIISQLDYIFLFFLINYTFLYANTVSSFGNDILVSEYSLSLHCDLQVLGETPAIVSSKNVCQFNLMTIMIFLTPRTRVHSSRYPVGRVLSWQKICAQGSFLITSI